jgi:DNA-binding CsgD family transcriptional regulator/pimeloyl-ACP methyl ester carboxylesterase
MDAPPIRFVQTTDGVSIAYWKMGDGPAMVQMPALPHSHIQLEWEIPDWRRGYELGVSALTVLRYDGRGSGLSQRDVADFGMEAQLADLEAVMAMAGDEPVILYGIVNTCPVAITYAVRHPERVARLMLWIPVVDGSIQRDNPMLQAARGLVKTDWQMFTETVAHSLFGWEESENARRYAALIRAANDPDTLLPMVAALHEFNVTDLLSRIRCPTLIMHRPDVPLLRPGDAETVAATIPNAQLALFGGTSTAPYIGDWRAIDRAISGFLDLELRGAPRPTRALRLLNMKTSALSAREREIIELVAGGQTNREIAEQLVLATKTVENHVGRILVKLDLRSRTQLAAYAVEHGMAGKTAS